MKRWQVSNVMTTEVVAVREDAPVEEVLDILRARRFKAVPVVDDGLRVVGMVSRADLRPMPTQPGQPAAWRSTHGPAAAAKVGELMGVPAWTVAVDESLSVAAKRMYARRVTQLPVTGEAGRLVGIVSSTDLLRVFGRPDPAIRSDVIEQVLREAMGIDPERVHVVVRDGVVTLAGQMARRSMVTSVGRLAYTVPGVVSVLNRLSYDYDDTALRSARSFAPFNGARVAV